MPEIFIQTIFSNMLRVATLHLHIISIAVAKVTIVKRSSGHLGGYCTHLHRLLGHDMAFCGLCTYSFWMSVLRKMDTLLSCLHTIQ